MTTKLTDLAIQVLRETPNAPLHEQEVRFHELLELNPRLQSEANALTLADIKRELDDEAKANLATPRRH